MHYHQAAPGRRPSASLWIVIIALLSGLVTVACSSHEVPSTTSAPTAAPTASSAAITPSATNATKETKNVTNETKNPLTNLAAAAEAGKPIYAKTCAACHGDTGKGDGRAAAAFNPKPTDLTKGDVPGDPDGELFLTVKQGRVRNGKMTMQPLKTLSDEQIWQVVAYVRTLASK